VQVLVFVAGVIDAKVIAVAADRLLRPRRIRRARDRPPAVAARACRDLDVVS
jgi:hypothetical protein